MLPCAESSYPEPPLLARNMALIFIEDVPGEASANENISSSQYKLMMESSKIQVSGKYRINCTVQPFINMFTCGQPDYLLSIGVNPSMS